ncbi:hypothetical protein JRQ81_014177 [Phrynocephalus forsythii]|uniref:Oxidative stress-responsive serine-rich protein 1 n=1 Tax=Phrynocephalus forsythii TaxID=171643 RepID=A0A9Q1B2K4_9SAUR|nr:hypothetical protein JRQ81_014177 [Phrynocephalus forsythii]
MGEYKQNSPPPPPDPAGHAAMVEGESAELCRRGAPGPPPNGRSITKRRNHPHSWQRKAPGDSRRAWPKNPSSGKAAEGEGGRKGAPRKSPGGWCVWGGGEGGKASLPSGFEHLGEPHNPLPGGVGEKRGAARPTAATTHPISQEDSATAGSERRSSTGRDDTSARMRPRAGASPAGFVFRRLTASPYLRRGSPPPLLHNPGGGGGGRAGSAHAPRELFSAGLWGTRVARYSAPAVEASTFHPGPSPRGKRTISGCCLSGWLVGGAFRCLPALCPAPSVAQRRFGSTSARTLPSSSLEPLGRFLCELCSLQRAGERQCSGCCLTMLEIEENLQAAFKKLRVDSEGSTGSPVNERAPSRALAKTSDETKVKTPCVSKESWHWCLKKTLRGTARIQRRRRSKSPVLHPPKFIHCSTKMPRTPAAVSDSSCVLEVLSIKEFFESEQASHPCSDAGVKLASAMPPGTSLVGVLKNIPENIPAGLLHKSILKAKDLSDFQAVSEQIKGNLCACADEACRCKQWQDMKVYMFSGLQNSPQSAPERIVHVRNSSEPSQARIPSSSLKSCSEQARAHVDDVTIEDLSGYMEYFLYIPKKMSHMAEMMYT